MKAAARIERRLDADLSVLENDVHAVGAERGAHLARERDLSLAGNFGGSNYGAHPFFQYRWRVARNGRVGGQHELRTRPFSRRAGAG